MERKDYPIKDVADFLEWIKSTQTIETEATKADGTNGAIIFEPRRRYFRGQACKCWSLTPGIFRKGNDIPNEHTLLRKSSLRLANNIANLNGHLEKMVFFQHYGLKTRLLDVTFNPLIALYMACCENCNASCKKYNKLSSERPSCDGIVYVGSNTEAHDPIIAELTAKYVFEHEFQALNVNFHKFANDNNVNAKRFQNALFIEPPINNARLEAQNGAFILAPLISSIQDEKSVIMNKSGIDKDTFFENNHAIIKANDKEKILRELAMYGIDPGSIYKDIQEKLKAIDREVRWENDVPKLDI